MLAVHYVCSVLQTRLRHGRAGPPAEKLFLTLVSFPCTANVLAVHYVCSVLEKRLNIDLVSWGPKFSVFTFFFSVFKKCFSVGGMETYKKTRKALRFPLFSIL